MSVATEPRLYLEEQKLVSVTVVKKVFEVANNDCPQKHETQSLARLFVTVSAIKLPR